MKNKYIVGLLTQKDNGRYAILEKNIEFTCGNYIECFMQDESFNDYNWISGRVEADREGIYHLNNSTDIKIYLFEGMTVRVIEE